MTQTSSLVLFTSTYTLYSDKIIFLATACLNTDTNTVKKMHKSTDIKLSDTIIKQFAEAEIKRKRSVLGTFSAQVIPS